MAAHNESEEAQAPNSEQAVDDTTGQAQDIEQMIDGMDSVDDDAWEAMIARTEREEARETGGAIPEDDEFGYSDEFDEQLHSDEDAEDENNFDPDFPEEVGQEPEPEAEDEPEVEPETKPEGEEEEQEEGEPTTASRFRVRTEDPVEARALELKKRNPDLSLGECLDRAQKEINPTEQPATEEDGDQPEAQADPMDALQTQIQELEQLANAAAEDLDMVEVNRLNGELRKLERQYSKLEVEAERKAYQEAELAKAEAARKEAEEQAQFEAAEAESKRLAVEEYPDVTNPNSRLVARMREIDAELKATGNPLYFDPNKHHKIAQMSGNDLAIAPRRKSQPSAKPSQPKRTQPSPVVPASGAKRTAPTTSDAAIDKALDEVDNLDDYDEMINRLNR